jgi:hypothetical protein
MLLGKMYLVKDWFWFLYPTKEMAAAACGRRVTTAAGWSFDKMRRVAYQDAQWSSERHGCNVAVVEPNTYIVLLEQDKDCFKFLDSNGNIGWIRCLAFSASFEIVKE